MPPPAWLSLVSESCSWPMSFSFFFVLVSVLVGAGFLVGCLGAVFSYCFFSFSVLREFLGFRPCRGSPRQSDGLNVLSSVCTNMW